MSSLMGFFHAVERLKTELRHAYKSSGSQESVAEHSWRLCLMTMVLSESIKDIDATKSIKMALVHDLPEVFAGDVWRLDLDRQKGRHESEKAALDKLTGLLPESPAQEITSLWLEFEEGITREARLVRLIDRLEVLVQHNEADISKWDNLEKEIQYGLAEKHAERYGFLHELASEIDAETWEKLTGAGERPEKLGKETYVKYYGSQGNQL